MDVISCVFDAFPYVRPTAAAKRLSCSSSTRTPCACDCDRTSCVKPASIFCLRFCKRAFCAALSRLSPATHPAGGPGAGGSGSASHGLGSLIGVECWFFVEAFHFDCLFPVDFKQKGSTACPNQLEYLHVGLQSNSPNTASP